MSLSSRILLGLLLGLVCGVFFGEPVEFVGVAGDAFILLLQMTVLPYVAASLMVGLGSLRYEQAVSLARHAGVFLGLLWAIGLTVVVLMPLAYPDWKAASFFSTTLVEQRPPFNFLQLFIPANPFRSLADNLVPAVVVFSAALGLALIAVERKDGLLRGLGSLTDALSRVAGFVMKLAPFGVFAIAARAGATLDLQALQGLQVYVAVMLSVALVMIFWVMPGLVVVLTPFRYRDVFGSTREALITAFATGNLFVVLPTLAERSKDLLRQLSDGDEAERVVDVVVPTSFNVPSMGKLLSMSFILFAGWMTGYAIPVSQYPAFITSGLASFFGSTMVAIPFLLDLFRIPADTFELFVIADSVIVSRFGALAAAMFVLSLTLLSASASLGRIEVRAPRVLSYAGASAVLIALSIGGVRLGFEALGREYEGYRIFIQRGLLEGEADARVLAAPPDPLPEEPAAASTLDRIAARGLLRVGYFRDRLPYAFVNDASELVGFDVELLYRLARDLGVELEFVKVDREEAPALLAKGYLDLTTSVPVTPKGMRRVRFPISHLDETVAFVVRDYRSEDFSCREAVKALEDLRIGVGRIAYYQEKVRRYLPDAEIVEVESPRPFFRGETELDAVVMGAAQGSAWSLIYPAYTVAIPHPDVLGVPMAYPVALGDEAMADFLDRWLELKERDRTIDDLFAYWIEGKDLAKRKKRWSVIRDVLHWVD